MLEDVTREQSSFPYIPVKAWASVRDALKRSHNIEISSSFLENILSVSEASAKKIQKAFRLIGIIDDNNRPTEIAERWRHDDEYLSVNQEILKSTYPSELESLFPALDSAEDRARLNKWIMRRMSVGEAQARQYSSFFILLRTPELPDTKESNNSKKRVVGRKKNKSPLRGNGLSGDSDLSANEPDVQNMPITTSESGKFSRNEPKNSGSDSMTLHIDLQIHISPDSSSEQIDKIFSSISKYIYNRESKD